MDLYIHKIYHDIERFYDNKRDIYFQTQKYVQIIQTLIEREEELLWSEYIKYLQEIKAHIPNHLWDHFSKRNLPAQDLQSNKFLKKPINKNLLVLLNQKVLLKIHKYSVASKTVEKAVLKVEYLNDILSAVKNTDSKIDSELNCVYNKNFLFKIFPKFGKKFFIKNF